MIRPKCSLAKKYIICFHISSEKLNYRNIKKDSRDVCKYNNYVVENKKKK